MRRWGTPTDAPAVNAAHQPLSSAMRSNDVDDWPIHSLMLYFYDLRGVHLRRIPSTVP